MKKLLIIDIDGVLNDYPACFLDWINQRYNHRFDSLADARASQMYGVYKDQYRKSGSKLKQEVSTGALEFLDAAKENGWQRWVVTSRVNVYENHANTKKWLNEKSIGFEKLIFCREKKSFLNAVNFKVLDQILVIDDQEKFLANIWSFFSTKYPNAEINNCLFLEKPNTGSNLDVPVLCVNNFKEMEFLL